MPAILPRPGLPTMMSSPPSADELVEAAVAEEHVVAVDAIAREDFIEVVARGAVEGAGLDPVVAFVAEDALGVLVAIDEVVAFAGEHFRAHVGAEEDEVLASATHDKVQSRTGMDDVVAVLALDVVVTTAVHDDVVTGAAVDDVVAEAAFQPVVAAIAKQRVVANAGDEDVVAARVEGVAGVGAAENDVIAAGVAQIVCICADGCRVVADDQRRQDAAAAGSVPRLSAASLTAIVRGSSSRIPSAPAVSPRPGLYCLVRSISRIRPGVENTSDGKCVASVLRMIRLANELFSISPNRCRPSSRCR